MSDHPNVGHKHAKTAFVTKVTVIGIGGAGGNAVGNMIQAKLAGVDFVVANTDAQALAASLCDNQIQLGPTTTNGLGAGSRPDMGVAAAEESLNEIKSVVAGSDMLFITAGMGGGTGTGAAPIIARAAREEGVLVVGVVTKPFEFEGPLRMHLAEEGINELSRFVDALVVVPNQNLFQITDEDIMFADAFKLADSVLNAGIRCITDVIVLPGLVNIDFADVRAVMSQMGRAVMGSGEAEGENRAILAAEAAVSNPLLEVDSIASARNVLINITGGSDLSLLEVTEAANRVRAEVNSGANIIFGSAFDEKFTGKIRVSMITTGTDEIRVDDSAELDNELDRENMIVLSSPTMSTADLLPVPSEAHFDRDISPVPNPALSQTNTNDSGPEDKDSNQVSDCFELDSGAELFEPMMEIQDLGTSSPLMSGDTNAGELRETKPIDEIAAEATGLLGSEQEAQISAEILRLRDKVVAKAKKTEPGISKKMGFVVVADADSAQIYKFPSHKLSLLRQAPYARRLNFQDSLGKAKSAALKYCDRMSENSQGNVRKKETEGPARHDFLLWSEDDVPVLVL